MLNRLLEWLGNLQGQLPPLYLAGGVVRDRLLGKPIKDIDIVCRNAEICSRTIAREKNATVVPFVKKADVPCYRIVDCDDQAFVVDISEMRGNNIREDLEYRDFCMNAMAIEIAQGAVSETLIDPLGGRNDIERKIIRLCSDHAINDDPLRMLRAIRFSAELGFTIEKNTKSAIYQQAFRLKESAPERIMSELILIFNVGNCAGYIRQMDRFGLLEFIFPQIQPMKGCIQNLYHHEDVWEHSLSVVEHIENIINYPEPYFAENSALVLRCLEKNHRLAMLKMAGLLHDVAKPVTRREDPESKAITFYGHDSKGSAILSEMAMDLKLSKKNRLLLEQLTGEHIHVVALSGPEVKKSTIIRFFRNLGDNAILSIVLSMADVMSKRGPLTTESRKKSYLDWCGKTVSEYFDFIKNYLSREDLISGKDLIAMGIPPGPEMGEILKKVREARDSGYLQNKADAVALVWSMVQRGKV